MSGPRERPSAACDADATARRLAIELLEDVGHVSAPSAIVAGLGIDDALARLGTEKASAS